MSVLAGYIIIAFLFFLGFSLYDFIAYNSNFNLKKAIKHPFSLFFCFLFHTITENLGLLFFLSLFWPISALVMLIYWLKNLFEDKLKAFLKKSSKKIDEKYREARQKIGID